MYAGVKGANVETELTAELVGDYLFTDEAFIKQLSTQNRNVFQKIFDEIKYLCKIVTAGSKEAKQLERIKREFEKAYNENNDIQKNTTEESSVKLSISKTSKMRYGEQLKLIENGELNGSNSLYIGTPSKQLQVVGISEAPFAMNQSDYRKSRRESAKNKKYSSHAVPYDFFANMQQHLTEAPILIDNGEKLSVITSYAMKDTKGNDSYILCGVWQNQPMESDTVNLVKSVYPLDDFAIKITQAAENGKLIIANKNKAEEMLSTIGIKPSKVSSILSLAKGMVSQSNENVNNISENSQSDIQYSLSDSDRNTLTNVSDEFFEDQNNETYSPTFENIKGNSETLNESNVENEAINSNSNIDNYTEKQYNSYGWARYNNVLSASENSYLRSRFAEAVSKQATPPKTKSGEYMIELGDNVHNKIAYMKGTIDDPYITRILEIDGENETEIDEIRRETYALERRGIQRKTGGAFHTYTIASFGSPKHLQGSDIQGERYNNKLGVGRGGDSKKAPRVKEYIFGENGSVTERYSETDKSNKKNVQFSLSNVDTEHSFLGNEAPTRNDGFSAPLHR